MVVITKIFDDINIKFWIYVALSVLLVIGGAYKVNEIYQMFGALVYGIGTLYVCVIYGVRWFGKGGLTDSGPVAWPPVVNTCPDYLTYYKHKKTDGTTEDTCIDTMGIANASSIKLQLFPSNVTDPANAPTDASYYFQLATTTNNKSLELCQRAIGYGLTWEGITNGESCFNANGGITPYGDDSSKCTK